MELISNTIKNQFEFNDWTQLVRATSTTYPNLRISIIEYNSNDIVGTKITIYDITNNDTYFTGFVRIVKSTSIPEDCCLSDYMIDIINSYGFNVKHLPAIKLQPNVLDTIKGLYSLGYRYLHFDYKLVNEPHDEYGQIKQRKRIITATYEPYNDVKPYYIRCS